MNINDEQVQRIEAFLEQPAVANQALQTANHTSHPNRRIVALGAGMAMAVGLMAGNSHDSHTANAASAPIVTLAEAHNLGIHPDWPVGSDVSTTSSTSTTEAPSSTIDTDATTTSTTEVPTTPVSTEAPTTIKPEAPKFMEPGVIGERPCGPQVNPKEVALRLADNEIVIKPGETAHYLNSNPQLVDGFNTFWNGLGNTDWINFVQKNVNITNPVIVQGQEDAGIRALKSRMDAYALTADMNVINHNCDIATGNIFENDGPHGSYNHLKKGDQVWAIELSADQVKAMADAKIEIPEQMIVIKQVDKDGKETGAEEIVMERIACNNPLLELLPPAPVTPTTIKAETTTTTMPEESTTTTTTPATTTTLPSSTTTSTTIVIPTTSTSPETTTTSTIPESTTTSTTIPESTTTTTPESTTTSTTIPESTTTSTTIPESTTTTTIPEETTTTSTTIPTTTTTVPSTTTTSTLPNKIPGVPAGTVPSTTIEAPVLGTDIPTTSNVTTTTSAPNNQLQLRPQSIEALLTLIRRPRQP
jgi:hypothetical protein